jgi:hypothetical protein
MMRLRNSLLVLPGVLVKGVQLGHAVRRLQVFGAQDYDDQIGLAQRLHEGGNRVAVFKRSLVANHLPILLFQRPAQPFDHFLALAVFFGGVGRGTPPSVGNKNLGLLGTYRIIPQYCVSQTFRDFVSLGFAFPKVTNS